MASATDAGGISHGLDSRAIRILRRIASSRAFDKPTREFNRLND
jgi:hypothetical protein